MSYGLNGNAIVMARIPVTAAGVAVSNTPPQEVLLKNLLIAAFQAIPSQAGGTATVAAIVTALQTLP